MAWIESFIEVEASRPEYTVADVLRLHWEEYCERYPVSEAQRRAAWHIMRCRTAALGGHIEVCDVCGRLRVSYNS